jgi:hypothetical protein
MHHHVRRAARAALDPPAGGTGEHWRIAAPIEENQRLFAARKAGSKRFQKWGSESFIERMNPGIDEMDCG